MHRLPTVACVLEIVALALAPVRPIDNHAAAAERRYLVDAHGQPARVAQSWDIHGTEWQGIGAISSLVRCGDEVFLADRNMRVRRYDLKRRELLRDIGADNGDGRLGRPSALAADCRGQLLYVVDGGLLTVFAYRLPSGTFYKKYPLPKTFAAGRSAEYLESGVLQIGGLWYPEHDPNWSFNELDFEHFFDTLRFGLTLPLDTGKVATGFRAYEDKCISAASCLVVNLARVKGSGSINWAIAQAASQHVGLYAGDGKHISSIDITSPMFLRSGIVAGPFTMAREYVLWMRDNSEIDRVFAFGKVIATSHMVTTVAPDWNFGPVSFRVHMNLHAIDGRGLVSDISLPDRPVGRDDTNIYVVDYGKAGRQPESPAVRLLLPVWSRA